MDNDQPGRLAWARLNAYGILLACLALMGVTDFLNPGGTDLARLVGSVPPGQPFWVGGYIVSGLLLLFGFARTDRFVETLGLALLSAALMVQTAVAYDLLGMTKFTETRIALIVVVGVCSWARMSVLWARKGLTIHIPPRDGAGE